MWVIWGTAFVDIMCCRCLHVRCCPRLQVFITTAKLHVTTATLYVSTAASMVTTAYANKFPLLRYLFPLLLNHFHCYLSCWTALSHGARYSVCVAKRVGLHWRWYLCSLLLLHGIWFVIKIWVTRERDKDYESRTKWIGGQQICTY